MNTVIYADILVAVNMIVNYLLLRASAAITNSDYKTVRLFLSALAGGIFSMVIFIENIPMIVNALMKMIFLAFMVAIAFGAKTLKSFLKNCASFFIANFGFAGIMLAVCTFIAPDRALYKNGVVYFDINILTLIISSLFCYGILTLLSKFAKSRTTVQNVFELTVTYSSKEAKCKALYDTGCSLKDGFSGRPVIIADKGFAEKLYGENGDVTAQKNFRLIPYSTIKNGGALPAFMADKISIKTVNGVCEAERIYIAVAEREIVSGGFSALLGVPVMDSLDNQIKCNKTAAGRKINAE